MSRGINKVILVGNLGQDPEIRYTPSGNAVSTISIATTDSWKDKNTGQLVERTEWHRVILFGKLAEVAAEYLRKGSQVYIEGRLQTRKWNDQAGVERFTTEIIVDTSGQMQMLGGRTPMQQPHINQQNNVTNRFSPQPMQSNGLDGVLPPDFDDDDNRSE